MMDKWTSTKEKLPEKDGKYLCVVKGYGSNFYQKVLSFTNKLCDIDDLYSYENEESGFYNYDNGCGYYICEATHWMALPVLPEGETE